MAKSSKKTNKKITGSTKSMDSTDLTDSTKATETPETDQLIAVDAGKLSLGLQTVFEGVSMIFASLGVNAPCCTAGAEKGSEKEKQINDASDPGNDVVTPAVTPEEETQESSESEVPEKADDKELSDSGGSKGSNESNGVDGSNKSDKADEADEAGAKEVKAEPSISLDDLTQLIVQKIKQNRSNNEKISQLLKTYGATKLIELDPAKFEEFQTEVTAL